MIYESGIQITFSGTAKTDIVQHANFRSIIEDENTKF